MVVRAALEAGAADVLAADGYLLGTPANFGYMCGALKHFFDSIFLQAGGALADDGSARGGGGRPQAVRALRARPLRHDGCRAVGAVDRAVRSAGGRARRCSRCWATWVRRSGSRRTSWAGRSRRC